MIDYFVTNTTHCYGGRLGSGEANGSASAAFYCSSGALVRRESSENARGRELGGKKSAGWLRSHVRVFVLSPYDMRGVLFSCQRLSPIALHVGLRPSSLLRVYKRKSKRELSRGGLRRGAPVSLRHLVRQARPDHRACI